MITFNHDNFIGDVAYIVENDVLLHSILKELEPLTNITIKNDAKIEQVLLEKDGLPFGKVRLATGESFTAELLVIYLFIYSIILFYNISFKLIKNIIELRVYN